MNLYRAAVAAVSAYLVCAAAAAADSSTNADSAAPIAKPRLRNHHGETAAQVLDEHVRALTKELNLDQKQQAAVREVLIKERMAVLELRRNGAQGGQDVVAQSHAIVARTRTDIRALLNTEQRAKYFAEVPEDKLAPAQADRDYWLKAIRPPQVTPAAAPAAAAPANSAPSP